MRVNEEIQAPKVRVIDMEGKQLGVFLIKDARRLANERGRDLVEIAPQAKPPVCKIIDFGKFRYEQQKKEKIQKKNQQVSVLKEIRFHPNTDVHDFDFKTRHAVNFLEDGNKVKATVVFKGREMAYIEQGEVLLKRFLERVQDVAKVEVEPKMEGRNMSLIVVPNSKKGKKKQS
ncbi:MAG: translation initiation factor IF-3 [Ignavibacteriota bacterium]|nr:MAG: translation initiation factor IF-3 [Chlorobiota bacterium]MBE7477856.1 translation initiation factor IF-3 [Ignavibacteriales bacterium]MBL1124447.1 translation initiation factor IF-3 [Ignavibacteriota bacterium]MCC7092623.1 translation initiation factor IF-3 [Ignavibacteriaceae bacterium]MCE7857670.1 translation initiation factor IF-3 [Ignavibacteria bacterium CHB3]MEB2296055.1 translation initiation factor IF-3 [Ignavibacteria bacterium]